jgi:hypothetical protein
MLREIRKRLNSTIIRRVPPGGEYYRPTRAAAFSRNSDALTKKQAQGFADEHYPKPVNSTVQKPV